MDVVQRSARERAARPRPAAFRGAAAAALTRPYKRWPKIERKLCDSQATPTVFKLFSKQFWHDRCVGTHVWVIYTVYTYIKAVREGPALRLSQK